MDGNLNKDLDENLARITQKTEDPKSNKGNLTFPLHTVNVIDLNCKVIKKVATLLFYINPRPFSGLSPPFLARFCTPLSDSILERSYPLPLIRGGKGGSNYEFSLCLSQEE